MYRVLVITYVITLKKNMCNVKMSCYREKIVVLKLHYILQYY